MKLKGKTIKTGLGLVAQKFSKNLFSVLLLLLGLDLVLGGFFFWQYYLKEKEIKPQAPQATTQSLATYQGLLDTFSQDLAKRENIFKAAETKQYPDPFRGL